MWGACPRPSPQNGDRAPPQAPAFATPHLRAPSRGARTHQQAEPRRATPCTPGGPFAPTLTPRAAASRGQGPRIVPAARAPPPAGSGGPGAGLGPVYPGRAGDAPGLQAPRGRARSPRRGALAGRRARGRWGQDRDLAAPPPPPPPPPPSPPPARRRRRRLPGRDQQVRLSFGSALAAILSRTSERAESAPRRDGATCGSEARTLLNSSVPGPAGW
jgi:hypothetical protein